jgi:hypothetical protein
MILEGMGMQGRRVEIPINRFSAQAEQTVRGKAERTDSKRQQRHNQGPTPNQ